MGRKSTKNVVSLIVLGWAMSYALKSFLSAVILGEGLGVALGATVGGIIFGVVTATVFRSFYVFLPQQKSFLIMLVWLLSFVLGETADFLIFHNTSQHNEGFLRLGIYAITSAVTHAIAGGIGYISTVLILTGSRPNFDSRHFQAIVVNWSGAFAVGGLIGWIVEFVAATALLIAFGFFMVSIKQEITTENTRFPVAVGFAFGGLVKGLIAGMLIGRNHHNLIDGALPLEKISLV